MKKHITFDIETTGLYPWYGSKVTCICAKADKDVFSESNTAGEKKLLTNFHNWLSERPDFILVSCNGWDFDVPFLCSRASQLSLNYSEFLREHFDIQKITTRRISLNNMAILFNLPIKKGSGTKAIKWFEEKKFIKLEEYCMHDVVLTDWIYRHWSKNEEGFS